MRFRHVFLTIGSILTLLVLFLSDPDLGFVSNLPFGAGTLTVLVVLVSSVLYVGLLHLSRKALFDYLDLAELFRKAVQSPEGAGLALVAVAIAMVSISLVILAATK